MMAAAISSIGAFLLAPPEESQRVRLFELVAEIV
jgi:hypothetical protein